MANLSPLRTPTPAPAPAPAATPARLAGGAALAVAVVAGLYGLFVLALRIQSPGLFSLLALGTGASFLVLNKHTPVVRSLGAALKANRLATRVTLLLCLLSFPWLHLSSPYWIFVAVLAGLYVIMALGLNVVIGFAGLLDLGFVAFYAMGAYTSGLLTTKLGLSFWVALPAGALVATASGILLGFPALRLRHDYLALVTIGFGEIVRILANNLDFITGGPSGMTGIKPPTLFGYQFAKATYVGTLQVPPQANYYYLVLAAGIATVWVASRLENGRLGRAWAAVREDQLAAASLGIDVPRAKLLAFAVGACFGGISGVIFANMNTFISPESFGFYQSVIILGMVVFGGMGNIAGVVVGAIALTVIPEKLREYEHYRLLIFGLVLVLMMLFRPEGLLPNPRRRAELRASEDGAEA